MQTIYIISAEDKIGNTIPIANPHSFNKETTLIRARHLVKDETVRMSYVITQEGKQIREFINKSNLIL